MKVVIQRAKKGDVVHTVWLQFPSQAVFRCVCVSDFLADIKGILNILFVQVNF